MKVKWKYYLLGLFFFICFISFLVLYKQPIDSLPNADEVSSVKITYEYGAVRSITSDEEIGKVLTVLEGAYIKFIKMRSWNETPVNTSNYMTIDFKLSYDDYGVKVYLYNLSGESYLEMPYTGIYRISDKAMEEIKKIRN